MSGIRDPLLVFFMEENVAKDKVLKTQATLIANLQLNQLNDRAELAHAFHIRQQLEERILRYQSMLRSCRDRVNYLEDHLRFYTGDNRINFVHIDSDSDTISLASDSDSE